MEVDYDSSSKKTTPELLMSAIPNAHAPSPGKSSKAMADVISGGSFEFQGKIFARKLGSTSFRIVIFQGAEQLYLRGTVECRLVFGSAECFGYQLGAQYNTIVSSMVTGLMSIETAARSHDLSLSEWYALRSSGGPSNWTEEDASLGLEPFVKRLVASDAHEVANSITAILILKDSTSSSQTLDLLKDELVKKERVSDNSNNLTELATATLLGRETTDMRPLRVPSSWRALTSSWQTSTVPLEIMACGKKHIGKSTLMRFLVNVLLQKHGKVCFLDLDLGQPELTAPGFVSLSVVSKPMLGPSFSNLHLASPDWQELHFVGTPSAKDKLGDIFDIAMLLYSRYKYSEDSTFRLSAKNGMVSDSAASKVDGNLAGEHAPLVINTHGWIEGPGWEMLARLVANVQPTDLIQIYPSTDQAIFSADPKAKHSPFSPHTSLHALHPVVTHHNYATIKATEKRIMQTMSALGTSRTVYRLPWGAFRIHLLDVEVPPSQVMYVLNASIVALVVDCTPYVPLQHAVARATSPTNKSSTVDPPYDPLYDASLPTFTMEPPPYLSSYCVGLGIIVSIDMEKRCFYLATNVPLSQLLDVNTLLKGSLELPVAALMATATPSTPYLTADSANAEGSSKLKVRTNIVRG